MIPSAHAETLTAIRHTKKVTDKATFRGRKFVNKLFSIAFDLKSLTMI